MGKFKAGDQVSFVNEKGGGTIVSVTRTGHYRIAIEGGFEITVAEKELAMVKQALVHEEELDKGSQDEMEGIHTSDHLFSFPVNEVNLVIAPSLENQVLTGDLDFFLCNTTSYQLLFVLSSVTQSRHFALSTGLLDAGRETKLMSCRRADLADRERLHIQAIFSGSPSFLYVPPVKRDIAIELPDLSVQGKGKGKLAFARFIPVYRQDRQNEPDFEKLKDNFSDAGQRNYSPSTVLQNKWDKKNDPARSGILLNTRTVDLHIEKLLTDISGLDNASILSVQLRVFHKEMDQAILGHFNSIIFIHGVGEGILKRSLMDELKSYPGISWRQAAFEKYGAGAVEVLLK